ncbi:MAG: putative toxin-antitoxin system toxin component, PIN family [Actinomycetota bacterium]|nr:putative toxin-antitoxin system toxin component, PIN family [Actinomycetota bacterium]
MPETVVLDASVLISAFGWRGSGRRIYLRCREGSLRLATSPALIAELRRALHYPKLGFTEVEIESFVSDVLGDASVVEPSLKLEVVEEDPDDNRVLECAVPAGASWIVSGDGHLLDFEEYRGTRTLKASRAIGVPAPADG